MPLVIRSDGSGVTRRMRLIESRAKNPSGVWPRVGRVVSRHVARQFVTEGAHFGTPWQPLKPGYRLWKLRNGYGRKILVQSGQMKQTFTGNPMDVEEYGVNTARFGSNNEKAVWHHNGTFRNGKRVNPPRKIMGTNDQMVQEVADVVKAYIFGRGK